jgi:hypothetical protein
MGLSDKAQAILVFASVFLSALGTAAATIPSDLPSDWKATLLVVFWGMAAVGFALKEALGGSPPTTKTA